MGIEIERKFLFDPGRLQALGVALLCGEKIIQAYIATDDKAVVRVRVKGDSGFLTLKGKTAGATRSEFEYPIPVSDAESIIAELCSGPVISKTRYCIDYGHHLWELDVFHEDNAGLCIAEVEISSEDEVVEIPPWVDKEVTGDPRYYNNNLLLKPFCSW